MTVRPNVVVALLVSALGPVGTANAQYAFSQIDFPGATQTIVNSINNSGHYVGNYNLNGPGGGFAPRGGDSSGSPFIFDGNQITSVPHSVPYLFYTGINNNDAVSGNFAYNAQPPQGWTSLLIQTDPNMLHGFGVNTDAYGLNDLGTAVGSLHTTVDTYPAIWGPPNQINTAAAGRVNFGINDDPGLIVGTAGFVGGSFSGYVTDAAHQALGQVLYGISVPGEVPGTTQAFGINNSGDVVGTYNGFDGHYHGYLYSGGTFTTIDMPIHGIDGTVAMGINDHDQIVGYYSSGGIEHGFIADPIAGIPEPPTLAMFAAGLGLLGFAALRRTEAQHAAVRRAAC